MTSQTVDDNYAQLQESERVIVEREVLSELIRLHLQVLKRMPLVQLLLVSALALLLFKAMTPAVLFGWAALTVGAECIRATYAWLVIKRGDIDLRPKAVHSRLIALAATSGATIGLSAVLFMPSIPLPDQAMLGITLFTMPTAGISVAVSSRPMLAAYAFFILAPASSTWVMLYPHQTVTVAGMTAVYWLFLVSVANDGERLLRRSVTIRRERDRAVQDLERLNAQERVATTKAEHLSQTRSRVLASASHDLRQPLHALSVYSAVLASKPTPETLPEVAHNIDRLVRSLGSLLHGLLDLSRLSSDYYVPERQRISLDRLVESICQEYQSDAENKSLGMVLELEQVRLFDDPVAIARITRNLVDNAFKYTERGEVRIRLFMADNTATLTVEDTGKGIPSDEQSRIFEEFYQLDSPECDPYNKGIGLGLAIVQRLCDLIGAQLSLDSEPGVGSRFSVTFNTVVGSSSRHNISESTDSIRLQGKRFYVVDNEIDILDGMRWLLKAWDVDVETANSSKTTEALFNQYGNPHLLIVDLRLRGEEHGAELASRLRRTYGSFPVLVVTGETASESLNKVAHAGYPLLKKPITPETLYEAACRAIDPDGE
jgi:signal transduction histidine kinase